MAASKPYRWHSSDGRIGISASAALYPREPLLAACCVFMDDYYVWVDLSKDKKYYVVSLVPKKGAAKSSSAGRVAGEFQNELLSNVLRYAIASRNRPIREAVVRSALFFSQPAKEQAKIARTLASREKNA